MSFSGSQSDSSLGKPLTQSSKGSVQAQARGCCHEGGTLQGEGPNSSGPCPLGSLFICANWPPLPPTPSPWHGAQHLADAEEFCWLEQEITKAGQTMEFLRYTIRRVVISGASCFYLLNKGHEHCYLGMPRISLGMAQAVMSL